MAQASERRRAGRPRLRPASSAGVSAREEILDAAGELFVSHGVAATTTRQIAERVGIRQASLYYYFAGKDEILLELLTESVRPSLEIARALRAQSAGQHEPATILYALALIDVETLSRARHNIAILYLAPEVQGDAYADFRAERAELQAIYGRLGQAAGADVRLDLTLTGALIMQTVESVIHLRRTGELRAEYGHEIAAACLRLAGLDAAQVRHARRDAGQLLASSLSVAGPPVP